MSLRIETQSATPLDLHQHMPWRSAWYERVNAAILERPRVVDLVVVVSAIFIDFMSDTKYYFGEISFFLALVPLTHVALFWRRTHPAFALVIITTIHVYLLVWQDLGFVGLIFALYAWIVYGRNRQLVWTGTVAVFLITLGSTVFSAADIGEPVIRVSLETILFFGIIVAAGDRTLQRRRYLNQLEEKMARLETDRQRAAEIAAQQERDRVAREMHDVVAHSVSVMLVQATAAKWVLATSPEQTTTALENIEVSGREALTDLRRVLGVLRESDPPEYSPNPTIDKIPELIDKARSAGYSVTYHFDGDHIVPVGVQTALYRITQEALTNVMKHAGTSKVAVSVTLTTTASHANVHIVDDGKGAAAAAVKSKKAGHGLIGMNERVHAFGGELLARPRPGGGFEVRATLPYLLSADTHVLPTASVS